MAANWMRRTMVAAACAGAALLSACGSSTTANSIHPDSIVTFGDAMSDLGQNPNGRPYSVSDDDYTYNNWTREVAYRYDLKLDPANAGGTAYAQGNARVSLPDATGVTNAPSITAQIDSYLKDHSSFGAKQFVLMSGGMSDVIAGYTEYLAGTKTRDEYLDDMVTAGKQMADQVRRLHDAGAPRVLTIGTPNLGRTLWAKGMDENPPSADTKPTKTLEAATTAFNDALLNALKGLSGTEVLYADAQYYFNSMTGDPSDYNFAKGDTPICTPKDSSNGMNIGVDQLNASLCTTDTLVDGAKVSQYLFADLINYTPEAHRKFGDWVYDRMDSNW